MIDYNKVKNDIKRDEGFSRVPYYDTVGVPTIGYGRNLDRGISKEEAHMMLVNDMMDTIDELYKYEWFPALDEVRQRAIINMHYNLGDLRFKSFKRMIRALGRSHFKEAATEALDSKWAKQVGDRATRIVKMLRTGED